MAEMPNSFDLGLRTTGRATKPLVIGDVRDLELGDVESLQQERGVQPKPIKQLRQRHHTLAKLLAEGTPPGEAGLVCGYVASHVSILQADPSFKDLQKFYAQRADAEYIELNKKIAMLGEDAVDEITSRLEEDAEGFSVGQLLEVSKMALDRSGHGPQSNTNLNVNIGLAEKLQLGRQRALAARKDALLEAKPMKDITPEDAA